MLIKKLLAGFLSAALCCQMVIPARATEGESGTVTEIFCQEQVIGDAFAESGRHVLLIDTEASWYGMLNGQVVDEYGMFESVNTDGHLLYPVRSISQYLGFTVDWDSTAQTVVLHNANGKQVIFTIGETIAIVNGEPQRITAAPVIIEDKLMLPIRALMEALDGYVEYDPAGILTLMDDAADLTAAEAEALALMQQVILQTDRGNIDLPDTVQLAQMDDKTYYRIGRDGFYLEQNGARKRINLGKNVQYVLGIDEDRVYYVTGSINKEGYFINGHLCRADLSGKGRQVLAEYDDCVLSTFSQDTWHHDLPTYFFHSEGYDYILVYGGTSHHGGYYLYKLQDGQAVIKYYFDAYSKDWLLSHHRLYFIWHSMGVPWGLSYLQLNADPVYDDGFPGCILKDYRFLEIMPLAENRMLALVEVGVIPGQNGYVHPDPANYAFCQIDTDTLNAELLRTEKPPNDIPHINDDGELVYFNIDGELCRINLP